MALYLRQATASSLAHSDLISSTVESRKVPFQKAGEAQAKFAAAMRAQTFTRAMTMIDDRKAADD